MRLTFLTGMVFGLLLTALPLLGTEGNHRPAMTDKPPVIDGKLDDPEWRKATPLAAFKTFKPDFDKEPSEKTEVFVLYDRDYLYFGFNCLDSEPARIKASLSKRDNIDADDWIGIALDTFNDHQSGYLFCVNPLGVQMDGMLNADGNGDGSYDAVWTSQGKIGAAGYTVEMAIPFKSLRFLFRKNVVMGLMAARTISRKSEQLSFPPFHPNKGSILTQLQPIELSDIRYQRPVELLPAFTHAQDSVQDQGNMRRDNRQTDFSLTGKLGLTSSLTVDATYNPDFSQVEADAGQIDINLRHSLFYPEKRPFFLEGLENFQYGGLTEDSPLGAVVHTRTIVDPLFGGKLNGKLGKRDLVSSIFAVDEYPGKTTDDAELAGRNALFGILRYKHSMSQDSYVGGFYTDREFAGSYNRLLGADGRLRLSPSTFAEFSYFKSFSRTRDAAAYGGAALFARLNYSTRRIDSEIGFQDIARDFRTDVGYLTRNGVRTVPFFFMYHVFPRSKFFQKIEPFFWSMHTWDKFSRLLETTNIFALRFRMPRNSQFRFDVIAANEVYSGRRFGRGGWRVQGYTQIVKQLYLEASVRSGNAIYYDVENPYPGKSRRAYLGVVFQPTDKLSASLDLSYADFFRAADHEKIYDYTILHNRTVFQFSRNLFFRGIFEYNFYRKQLAADFLASFTYIPGTVIYLGYGSTSEKVRWDGMDYVRSDDLLETRRAFFFKASYLWRL